MDKEQAQLFIDRGGQGGQLLFCKRLEPDAQDGCQWRRVAQRTPDQPGKGWRWCAKSRCTLHHLLHPLGGQRRLADAACTQHHYQRTPFCDQPLRQLVQFRFPTIKSGRVGKFAPVYVERLRNASEPVAGRGMG